jgi:hypothetical protein
MNNLPTQSSTDQSTITPSPTATSVGKEVEVIAPVEHVVSTEQGKDIELPKEVSAIGVTIQPTTVVLPSIVQKSGVTAINPISSVTPLVSSKPLPLSDEEIAKGLHEGVVTSVRWLAEWCMRRLKQMHIAVKDVGGKLVRT